MNKYVLINAIPHVKTEEFSILVILKSKPDWQRGFLNLVGGKIEPEEEAWEAALRELKEETGLIGGTIHRMGEVVCSEGTVYCYNIYVDKDQSIKSEPDEPVFWMNWQDLCNDSRLLPSVRVIYSLMNAGIKDWTLLVDDGYMNKSVFSSKLILDSNYHFNFYPNAKVSSILNGDKQ